MTYLYVPAISIGPFDVGTTWTFTKSRLKENDRNTQLCLLDCGTPEEAEDIVEQMKPHRALSDNYYAYKAGSTVIASQNLLIERFGAEMVSSSLKQHAVSMVNQSTHRLIHLGLKGENFTYKSIPIQEENNENARKPAIYFPTLVLPIKKTPLVWFVDAGKFHETPLLTLADVSDANTLNKIEQNIKYHASKKNVPYIPSAGLIGRQGSTLVVSKAFLESIYGGFLTTTHPLALAHELNRQVDMTRLFKRWENSIERLETKKHDTFIEGIALDTKPIQLDELNDISFPTIDDYINKGGTLFSSSSGISSSQSFFGKNELISDPAPMDAEPTSHADLSPPDAAVENWIANVFKPI